MTNPVLDSDGKIANQLPCVYLVGPGIQMFSEVVENDGAHLIFRGNKTCVLTQQQTPQGFAFGWVRLDKQLGNPTIRRVPLTAVTWIENCTDPNMLNAARSELSGLTLASTK